MGFAPKRKKPLPKRWPGKWVFRGRVWDPEGESIETEGSLDDPIGPFIRTLMLLGFTSDFTSDRLLTEIGAVPCFFTPSFLL